MCRRPVGSGWLWAGTEEVARRNLEAALLVPLRAGMGMNG